MFFRNCLFRSTLYMSNQSLKQNIAGLSSLQLYISKTKVKCIGSIQFYNDVIIATNNLKLGDIDDVESYIKEHETDISTLQEDLDNDEEEIAALVRANRMNTNRIE